MSDYLQKAFEEARKDGVEEKLSAFTQILEKLFHLVLSIPEMIDGELNKINAKLEELSKRKPVVQQSSPRNVMIGEPPLDVLKKPSPPPPPPKKEPPRPAGQSLRGMLMDELRAVFGKQKEIDNGKEDV